MDDPVVTTMEYVITLAVDGTIMPYVTIGVGDKLPLPVATSYQVTVIGHGCIDGSILGVASVDITIRSHQRVPLSILTTTDVTIGIHPSIGLPIFRANSNLPMGVPRCHFALGITVDLTSPRSQQRLPVPIIP